METSITFIAKRFSRKLSIILMSILLISCEKEEMFESQGDTTQSPITDQASPSNQSPIAIAGPDQIITMPEDSILLDASASHDSTGIRSYSWRKIEGPENFSIISPSAVQTLVENLTVGIYKFELTVINTASLSAKDTVQVTVQIPSDTIVSCDNSERPQVFARLISLGLLSKSRVNITITSTGNKILFAGGLWTSKCPECWGSSRVDVYDTSNQQWSTAELSEGRYGIAAATLGDKIFFAGGARGDGAFDQLFSTVDIYDDATGTWSVANLSQPRGFLAAASVGNKVFFAGGEKDWDYNTSNVVDIFDIATNTWSTTLLSEARAYTSAISINNKIYFAGGQKEDRWYNDPSDNIDIYDNNTGNWSTSFLNQPMGWIIGIASDQDIYWASKCDVEIKNINTSESSMTSLSVSGSTSAALANDKIVFLKRSYCEGTLKFDIYDIKTKAWSIGVLPQMVYDAEIVTVNNTLYLSGTTSSCYQRNHTTNLWKLEY